MRIHPTPACCVLAAAIHLAPLAAAQSAPATEAASTRSVEVSVTYDQAITDSFTGRVYLMFTRGPGEPRSGPRWFNTEPFFAIDVVDWSPGDPLVFDDHALAYPGRLSSLEPANYSVQAVMRCNLDSPTIGRGEGSAYSQERRITIDEEEGDESVELTIDKLVEAKPFRKVARIELVELRSELLSAFHGRDITMRASVILPEGYDPASERRYPAYYWVNGFGGDHHSAPMVMMMGDATGFGGDIVRIVPDPLCYGGHHVFADSANNGPRGQALVQELIPHLEETFPLVAAPGARFLGGHSSGGWSSLWLQVAYPDFFGGVWSVAPDPVDFRDFQRINLYEPGANMFVDENGERRPVGRQGTTPIMWYDDFTAMEVVLGEGGQLRSFDWVFSPRGEDGLPLALYDRQTGAVDAAVADAWKAYDISLILHERWAELAPSLRGKLHVFMGELDNFYLEGATKLLKERLEALGSDAVVELVPGADHGSIATPALRERIDREMLEAFEKGDTPPPVPPRSEEGGG